MKLDGYIKMENNLLKESDVLDITDFELRNLFKIIDNPSSSSRIKTRANIIIALVTGLSTSSVAIELKTTRKTVIKWLRRYKTYGVDGLMDKTRSGRPPLINEEKVDHVMKLINKTALDDKKKLSIRKLSKHADISTWQVRKIYKHLKQL